MGLYYVRWPNGDHTFAYAKSKRELFDLLDEVDDPYSTKVCKMKDSHRFAFDFTLSSKGKSLLSLLLLMFISMKCSSNILLTKTICW